MRQVLVLRRLHALSTHRLSTAVATEVELQRQARRQHALLLAALQTKHQLIVTLLQVVPPAASLPCAASAHCL